MDYDYFGNVIDYDYDYIEFSSNVIDYDYVIVIVIMSTIIYCNYPMSDIDLSSNMKNSIARMSASELSCDQLAVICLHL